MKISINNSVYPFKHWLSSLVVAPFILMVQDYFSGNNNFSNALGIFMLFIIFGLLFSFPVFVLYFILYNFLISKMFNTIITKVILNSATIIGVFVIIKLIGGSAMTTSLALHYSATIIVCSFFFKIEKHNLADT